MQKVTRFFVFLGDGAGVDGLCRDSSLNRVFRVVRSIIKSMFLKIVGGLRHAAIEIRSRPARCSWPPATGLLHGESNKGLQGRLW